MDLEPPPSQRQTFLTIFLAMLLAAGFLVMLTLVTLGWLLYALVVVGGVVGMGWFHYWLWGRSMSEQVAQEREELEARDNDDFPHV